MQPFLNPTSTEPKLKWDHRVPISKGVPGLKGSAFITELEAKHWAKLLNDCETHMMFGSKLIVEKNDALDNKHEGLWSQLVGNQRPYILDSTKVIMLDFGESMMEKLIDPFLEQALKKCVFLEVTKNCLSHE